MGCLYEKYHGQGVSQKDFVSLLSDLGEKSVDAFHWKSGGQSIHFDAGRLFQRFATVDDGFIKEQGFLNLLAHVNACAVTEGRCGPQQAYVDEFNAGRVFQSFSEFRQTIGLSKSEFEMLMSNSPLGAKIHQMAANIFDMEDPHSDPSEENIQRPVRVPASTNEAPSSAKNIYIPRQSTRTGGASWVNEMKRLEHIRQELMAYERELKAEMSLRKDLPEAYSASKEKLLRRNIQALEQQHQSISSTLWGSMQSMESRSIAYNMPIPRATHYRTPHAYIGASTHPYANLHYLEGLRGYLQSTQAGVYGPTGAPPSQWW